MRHTVHARQTNSWSRFAARVVPHCGGGHFLPVAVEEWPLVLGLVGEGSDSAVGVIKLGESLRRPNFTPCFCSGLVEIPGLDPSGQRLVFLQAALAEKSVDVSQGRKVNVTVHVLGQNHAGCVVTGRRVDWSGEIHVD